MKREFQIRFLRANGLEPHHRLLDLGCGTLRGGIPLIALLEPGNYVGVEVRRNVLVEARRELEAAGLSARRPELLLAEDLRDLELRSQVDFIWAFSVLIHMSDPVLDGALDFAARHLAPDGNMYANVNIGMDADSVWHGFPVVHRPLGFYEAAAGAHGLDVSCVGTLKQLGHISGHRIADDAVMLRMRGVAGA